MQTRNRAIATYMAAAPNLLAACEAAIKGAGELDAYSLRPSYSRLDRCQRTGAKCTDRSMQRAYWC